MFISKLNDVLENCGSPASIVTALWVGCLGSDSWQGYRTFIFTTTSRLSQSHTQPHIKCVPGAVSSGVKWPGHEPGHSPLSSA